MSFRLCWSIVQALIAFGHVRFGVPFTYFPTVAFGHRQPMVRIDATASSTTTVVYPVKSAEVETNKKGFVVDVHAGPDSPTVEEAISAVLETTASSSQNKSGGLSARELLKLGSVWLLSRNISTNPMFTDPKPTRLTSEDVANNALEEGDFLRIYHSPKRFPDAYKYNWTAFHPSIVNQQDDDEPGVVVAKQEGFWIVNKPPLMPIHPTVDNACENVASMVRREKGGYVATPHRLDHNTSGLCVIATNKKFAAYFTNLLRKKTMTLLKGHGEGNSSNANAPEPNCGVYKRYKCMVCLRPPSASSDAGEWSVAGAIQQLKQYRNSTMRHYLEPSPRAPKTFQRVPGNESWLESLTNIVNVGEVYPLVGSDEGQSLATSLWADLESVPCNCVGVVEVELELLTGRTHQIRGQMAAEGFPLVGDAMYGGAQPPSLKEYAGPDCQERLALQSCQLDFLDPDVVVKQDDKEIWIPSERWNSFRLEESWWTPYLKEYKEKAQSSSAALGTMSMDDLERAVKMQIVQSREKKQNVDDPALLPPRASLSPGANKYVLVKAIKAVEELWFVKSATALECGGPYHANVAEELVEWLELLDYDVTVTGGGRIDYDVDGKRARVYGFSYGFGLGDHIKAAALITKHMPGVIATYDLSRNKY